MKPKTLQETLSSSVADPSSAKEARSLSTDIRKKAYAGFESDKKAEKTFEEYKGIQDTIVDPVEAKEYEEKVKMLQEQYKAASKSNNSKETKTAIAQSLIKLAGSVFAYKKGVDIGDVKFDKPDYAARNKQLAADRDLGVARIDTDRERAEGAQKEAQARADRTTDRQRTDLLTQSKQQREDREANLDRGLGLADKLAGRGDDIESTNTANRNSAISQGLAREQFEYGKERDTANDDFRDRQLESKKMIEAKKLATKEQKKTGDIKTQLADLYEQNLTYDKALKQLEKGGLTGMLEGTVGAFYAKARGGKAASTHKLLQKIHIDATMLNVAKTSGAVSDKEMALFASPIPDKTDQESVWIDWIKERQEVLKRVQERLRKGVKYDGSPMESTSSQTSSSRSQESEALKWAKENPDDPRSTKILKKLGK